MADNIRDVYSVVFTSLGEEKLVQQLNKVKKAADDMTHSLAAIQKLPGMNVAGGENASKLKSALKAVMDNEKIKQAAILKTEEVILKSDLRRIATDQKVADSLANNSLKFIALKQKEAQAKIEAERLYNQQFQKLLADEKEARAKMAAYVAADVAKDKAAKLKAADEYRQAFAKLRDWRDRLSVRLAIELPHLSMGMSDDLEAAIAEGATIVRIGTAIFGTRMVK
jgi:uncharacterized pyridoxal phosphate-containing UPF0001 family protein